jgi:hypothetical protein
MHAMAAVSDFKNEAVLVTEEQVEAAIDGRKGWCPSCADFTTPDIAMQDKDAVCIDCGEPGVLGVIAARRGGFVSVIS